MPLTHRHYLVYADGSCLGNPGPGGWGVVLYDPDSNKRELNGHADATTNNQMEITGVIEGLRATEPGSHVVVRTDSQYVVKTMTDGWKRKANLDLWKLLDAERNARTVRFEWVRGHGTDPDNNRADELALMGANGRLIADGATDEKPRARRSTRGSAANNDAVSSHQLRELRALLKHGESIRECGRCGAKFVSARDGDNFCSHAGCQLKSRSRG